MRHERAVQALWLAMALFGSALWAGIPISQWGRLLRVCRPVSTCAQFQLDAASAGLLQQRGVSLDDYAMFTGIVLATGWTIWYGMSALVIYRKPGERAALISAFFLLVMPLAAVALWVSWGLLLALASLAALNLFGLLFPDGRFSPRWTRWLGIGVVAACGFLAIPVFANSSFYWVIPLFVVPLLIAALQIYRFRAISSWRERQRSKWVFLGLGTGLAAFLSIIVTLNFVGAGNSSNGTLGGGTLAGALVTPVFVIGIGPVPLSIGIAILRSGLWDIDRVVSRALGYSVLTVILGAIYIGGVIGLQGLIGLIAGNGSAAAVVLSTLVVAALFGPLRRRLQNLIDSRFYRSQYDAARMVRSFAEQLRDEVDVDRLSTDLSSIVRQALHPSHVSLWLREQ